MPCNIQIYSPKGSAALDYVLGFIFDDFFGCGFELFSDKESLSGDALVFNYSDEPLKTAINILPCGYLFEKDLTAFPEIYLFEWEGIPAFFKTGGAIPFDLFSAVFFLLSRAEEYANSDRDKHGRFSAANSLFDTDFIQRPVIDEWLLKVGIQYLNNTEISLSKREFKWLNTYDVDVAYAYRHRPAARVLAASVRNLVRFDFKSFFERFGVLIGNKPDPYDTYHFQKEVSTKYADETIYFFLLANKAKFDRNLSYDNAGMKSLVRFVEEFAKAGIHPSYESGDNPELISLEIQRLEKLTGASVSKSRQHFLRFNLPNTYRKLVKNGISEDYSMGYADLPGFRAGTCTPHYFFDIIDNTVAKLRLYPLVIMEASLRDYLNCNEREARELIHRLATRVKAVDGLFTTLWHNDSLTDISENYWRDLYLEMAIELKTF